MHRKVVLVLGIALALSVALNAVLVGYGVTLYRVRPLALLSDPMPPVMLDALAARMPAEGAAVLRETLGANRPLLERERAGYLAALDRAARLIEADAVDAAALAVAVAEARGHRGRMGDVYLEAFVAMIAALPADRRRALVARFRSR